MSPLPFAVSAMRKTFLAGCPNSRQDVTALFNSAVARRVSMAQDDATGFRVRYTTIEVGGFAVGAVFIGSPPAPREFIHADASLVARVERNLR